MSQLFWDSSIISTKWRQNQYVFFGFVLTKIVIQSNEAGIFLSFLYTMSKSAANLQLL